MYRTKPYETVRVVPIWCELGFGPIENMMKLTSTGIFAYYTSTVPVHDFIAHFLGKFPLGVFLYLYDRLVLHVGPLLTFFLACLCIFPVAFRGATRLEVNRLIELLAACLAISYVHSHSSEALRVAFRMLP